MLGSGFWRGFLFIFLATAVAPSFAQNVIDAPPDAATKSESQKSSEALVIDGCWKAATSPQFFEAQRKIALGDSDDGSSSMFVTIADKRIVLFADRRPFAEMPFTLDLTVTPWAIDAVFSGQKLHGVCEIENNRLRLRLNGPGKASPDGFNAFDCDAALDLQPINSLPLMATDADGKNLRTLFAIPGIAFGSSAISADGRQVVVDSWDLLAGENYVKSQLTVFNLHDGKADYSSVKRIIEGTVPSWSPDGKKITFSRYGTGVCIASADGSDLTVLTEDSWGSAWSPKRNEIIYHKYGLGNPQFCLYDCETKKERLFPLERFSSVGWMYSWSPDGNRLAFRGSKRDGGEELLAIAIHGDGPAETVFLPPPGEAESKYIEQYVAWSSDGKKLAETLKLKGNSNRQIYLIDVEGKTPPERLPSLDRSMPYFSPAWSPNGKMIIFAAERSNRPQ